MSILVLAEHAAGKVKKSTYAAVSAARVIAERSGLPYDLVVLGAGAGTAAQSLIGYGARSVRVVEGPALANYLAMPWAAALATVAGETGARWLVATGTTTGKDVMPRVAVKLGAGVASDVIRIDGAGSDVKLVRPMWAGNVLGEVQILTETKVVTVRGSDWSAAEATGGASEVQASAAAADAAQAATGKMRFVSFAASGGERPELTEADTIVAGGRGLGSEEKFFGLLDPLADVLGAAIGATRAAVDSGYAPNDFQIGQTGKSVAPNLYFAIAISGAIQHLAGMKSSKTIVAINKNPDEPIFQVADYGLVADAFNAVPELVEAVKVVKG